MYYTGRCVRDVIESGRWTLRHTFLLARTPPPTEQGPTM